MILEPIRQWLKRQVPHSAEEPGDVTALLSRWQDASAREQLFAAIYPELKRVAAIRMQGESPGHTLQPTALVSEVYLQLVKQHSVTWQNRAHFLAIASEAMRRILVDQARARHAEKRGSGAIVISLSGIDAGDEGEFVEVLAIDDLLQRLAQKDPRAARVVQLRYFGGLTYEEIAEILNINARTAKRDWQLARAWLFTEMAGRSG
jgi:RNA polymerase sigma factor (TIGR02999 family)